MLEVVVRMCSVNYTQKQSAVGVMEKKVFLEMSQQSQENNCARVTFFESFRKINSGTGVFLWILRIF